jgi:two-component system chemotaxis response regulator CheY
MKSPGNRSRVSLPPPLPSAVVISGAWGLRSLLRALLEQASLRVTGEAVSLASAVALQRLHKPNVVILDVVRPDEKLVSTVAALALQDSSMAIVITTESATMESAVALREAGATAMVLKPFERPAVVRAVATLLADLASRRAA